MSEAEKKQRLDYKKNRKKWIMIQAIAIAVMAVIALGSLITYNALNKAYYIEYTELGDVDYKVYLKENDFFEDEWVGKDNSYVSSLIDSITADFNYELNMEADSVAFDYMYSVYAQLLISNTDSGEPIYAPIYELVPKQSFSQFGGSTLSISESAVIDYVKYNNLATEFTEIYDLDHTNSALMVTMQVDVVSKCDSFTDNSSNTYSVSLLIPLASDTNTIDIQTVNGVPTGESKVLAYVGSVNQNIFKIIGIVAAVLFVLLVIGLSIFAYLTRNEDIRYESKVKRLLSNYKAFIQVITNEFDTEGYQILVLSTFNEMLSIRDTIQSPILMNENDDKTCTRFLIPTNTKILYVFEIKVENFDAIYAVPEEPEILAEDVDEEALAEALDSPEIELSDIEYIDVIDEEAEAGVEVIGVVWPEKAHKNKIYRYDPDGAVVNDGDIVLVPSRDVQRNKDIIRKAAVAHGNHKVDPETLQHPLKKIIGIVKRKAEMALTPPLEEEKSPIEEDAVKDATPPVSEDTVDTATDETSKE